MSVEPYQWLLAHAEALGLPPAQIGPASVDLTLFPTVKCYETSNYIYELDIPHNANFLFRPGVFFLCSTNETIRVPDTHCALVQMRSTLARRGLGHKMAGFIDPGFWGQITLELTADIPVDVAYKERIVQIVYMRLTEYTQQPYQGQYQGQQGPTAAPPLLS